MKSAWSAAAGAFSFSAGPLAGRLVRSLDGDSSCLELGVIQIGSLRELTWILERDGSSGTAYPFPETAYIQQPYVVAPYGLNMVAPYGVKSSSGFRLTGFFRATDDGVDADFRLATAIPVTNVSLELYAEWSKGNYQPLPELAKNRRYPCPGAEAGIVDFGGGKAALFTDVGEHGVFTPTNAGATLRLFNQSLEKGVILVGRFAFRQAVDSDRIKRDFDDWLDHPSASL